MWTDPRQSEAPAQHNTASPERKTSELRDNSRLQVLCVCVFLKTVSSPHSSQSCWSQWRWISCHLIPIYVVLFFREWVAYAPIFPFKKATSVFWFHFFKKGCREIFSVWVVKAIRHVGLENAGCFLRELVLFPRNGWEQELIALGCCTPTESELFCAGRSPKQCRGQSYTLSHLRTSSEQQVSCFLLLFFFFSSLILFKISRNGGWEERKKHPSKFPQKRISDVCFELWKHNQMMWIHRCPLKLYLNL